jgi:2-polyprenyl-3-methyl-5-hydroxy-6-metoxy-1,4-benzoquinol methylase
MGTDPVAVAPKAPPPVKHNPNLHELVWSWLKNYPAGKLLDIPSGPGYFAQTAQQHGFDATAAEIDPSLHLLPGLRYQQIDMAQPMPIAPNTYDYIVSIEGIEHVENQYLFLRECFKALKPGGRLFMTTPNVSSLQNRLLFLLTGVHDNPPGPLRDDTPNLFMHHINLIPFHRLEAYLRFTGFQLEKLDGYKMRPTSQLLYLLIYPFAYLRYRKAFNRFYKGKPGEPRYRELFKTYLSRTVMCGEYHVLVAAKPA